MYILCAYIFCSTYIFENNSKATLEDKVKEYREYKASKENFSKFIFDL